jgi:putative MATE family efflux protein
LQFPLGAEAQADMNELCGMSALKTDASSLLRVALPISAGALVQFFVVFTDNMFLSRIGSDAMNGAGNAGLVYLTFIMIAIGSGSALQILIAQRQGKRDETGTLNIFRMGLGLHVILGLSLTALIAILNTGTLGGLIADVRIRGIFETFLGIRLLGFLPFSLLFAFNAFYTGTARTLPILLVSGTTALLNILLDALLIHGGWGLPALGAPGAAWASLISECAGLALAMVLSFFWAPGWWRWSAFRKAVDKVRLQEWWELAYPLMGQLLLTVATWTAFFFCVEKVGGLELKVSHATRNMFMLAFVVAQGMGQTTRTYVSHLIGAERTAELFPTVRRIFTLNLAGILLLCHGFVLYPEWLARFFFQNPTDVGAMAQTLHVIFVAVLMYAFTYILLATIQGSGATKAAFRIELLAVSVYLVAVVALTLVWPQPVHIIWRVEWIYFGMMGLGSMAYLRRTRLLERNPGWDAQSPR